MIKTKNKIRIIGITGGVGAGKTTLSEYIKKKIDAEVLNTDLFSKPKKEWKGLNPSSTRFDVLEKVLKDLKSGKPTSYSPFIKKTGKLSRVRRALYPKRVIIIEGILPFQNKRIRKLLDIGFYLDLPQEKRYQRRQKKYRREDLHKTHYASREFFNNTIVPSHKRYTSPLKKEFIVVKSNQKPAKIFSKIKRYL